VIDFALITANRFMSNRFTSRAISSLEETGFSNLNGTSTRQFQRQWNFYAPSEYPGAFISFYLFRFLVSDLGDLLALKSASLERI
jgi:hypothetical protein